LLRAGVVVVAASVCPSCCRSLSRRFCLLAFGLGLRHSRVQRARWPFAQGLHEMGEWLEIRERKKKKRDRGALCLRAPSMQMRGTPSSLSHRTRPSCVFRRSRAIPCVVCMQGCANSANEEKKERKDMYVHCVLVAVGTLGASSCRLCEGLCGRLEWSPRGSCMSVGGHFRL